MADLSRGRGPATSNGDMAAPRPATSRGAVGSPAGGIRTPRDIMNSRLARQAEQAEERERLIREHAEEEARLQEAVRRENERRDSERRATAAGAGTSTAGAVPGTADSAASRRTGQPTSARGRSDNGVRTSGPAEMPSNAAPQASQSARNRRANPRAAQETADRMADLSEPGAGPSVAGPSGTQGQPGSSVQPEVYRSAFPHAFERWETLSAHWEGLVSYWLRKLKQYMLDNPDCDPITQQLSRQVADLAAAGGNLFHAVVELQRLRASSERKFQRWFYETREEKERMQEVLALLEAQLLDERKKREEEAQKQASSMADQMLNTMVSGVVRELNELKQELAKKDKQVSEMRKELSISKEEARRAWEELGRREQEERDRTSSLQQGHPTIVGGVQVVPMTQGVSRGNSQRDARTYQAPSGSEDYAGSPVSRPARHEYSQAPAVQPVTSSAGSNAPYQTPSAVHHQESYGSEGTFSEGKYSPFSGGACVLGEIA
ncbi:hypothetical protein F4780DRAFT_360033 [Xylariomycetidae sp. FL0641]|nr:hypothetical protein F4780DRAFT_360033 [Xylariomycetidae sp. FL0641]